MKSYEVTRHPNEKPKLQGTLCSVTEPYEVDFSKKMEEGEQ
jgi:hypothetical protein